MWCAVFDMGAQDVRDRRKKLSAKTLWKVRVVPPAATEVDEAHAHTLPWCT